MTESIQAEVDGPRVDLPLSLSTAAARNLATTTKSAPQMRNITPRWLLRVLPWVDAPGGSYRVNRRATHAVGSGRVEFSNIGDDIRVVSPTLAELPLLDGLADDDVLGALADAFTQRSYGAGEVIAAAGDAADELLLVAHGKVQTVGAGEFGDDTVLGTLADGDFLGGQVLMGEEGDWRFTVRTVSPTTVLALSRADLLAVADRSATLREHLAGARAGAAGDVSRNKHGEASIELSSGHHGEPRLPSTYADYELSPREYELSVAQTMLNIHTRVADLYNQPMNQTDQQLRLTIEALRERQEFELVNNPTFGLLHNADLTQRIPTSGGPPTPDDLDELLSRRRRTEFILAHPKAVAAFGKECTRRGIYPGSTVVDGSAAIAWRGVPVLPCDKIPIGDDHTTSVIAMRTGEEHHGVIGLHQTGIPDEYRPGLSVRFMGVNDKAVLSYLVSAYYSAAILVPDAVGVLEHVQLGR